MTETNIIKEEETGNMCFAAVLTRMGAVVKDEDVIQQFVIQHNVKGDDQVFLFDYEEVFNTGNIGHLFRAPVRWKTLNIYLEQRVNVKFDKMEFPATLIDVRVAVRETKDDIIYSYNFVFEKKQSKDVDTWFATYLKHKEEDINTGKKFLVEYDVELEYL